MRVLDKAGALKPDVWAHELQGERMAGGGGGDKDEEEEASPVTYHGAALAQCHALYRRVTVTKANQHEIKKIISETFLCKRRLKTYRYPYYFDHLWG
jgi:hypothetical protein